MAQEFVNEGVVHAEQFGDLSFAAALTFHRTNYSFSQVYRVSGHGAIKNSSVYSFKRKPLY